MDARIESEILVNASISSDGTVEAAVEGTCEIGSTVGGMPLPEKYDGSYELIPDFEEHRLPTRNKRMTNDVTMTAIPVHYVSNESGGTTVTIGRIGISNG